MRQVRDKNRYWTVLKCLCSAAVLSGSYRPFKLGCQRTEETQLLKSQRIINSVLDLQICTAYQKSVICHMPNALCPIMQPLLGSSCSKEKKVAESEGQRFRSMMDCGREGERPTHSQPLNKKRGVQELLPHTSFTS